MRLHLLPLASVLCVAGWFAALPARAVDVLAVPKEKQTSLGLYLSPLEAHRLKQQGGERILFVDVRTRAEVQFLGVAEGMDAHVPYVELSELADWDEARHAFRLEPVSGFEQEIARRLAEKGLGKDATIIVQCRSGDRSARAVNLLASQGYTMVYNQVEGFEGDLAKDGPAAGKRAVNGWKNAGLPWSYRLTKTKMYFPNH